jgi:F420-0:gamma-glutamyl ligase-like protein
VTDESIIAIISIAISFLFGYVIGRGIEMEENTSKNYRKTKEEQMLLYKHMKEFAESLRRENDKEIIEMGFESRNQYE